MSGSRALGPTVRAAIAMGAIAVLFVAVAPRAEAIVYWTGWEAIERVNQDGTHRSDSPNSFGIPSLGFIPSADHVCGLAVTATHIFWGDLGTSAIGRANLDGSAPDNWFITGVRNPCLLAVGTSHVYWANEDSTVISRANIDGSQPVHDFLTETQPVREIAYTGPALCGAAVDSSHIYWANLRANAIGRASLDGSLVEPEFIPEVEGICGVAVNSSHIYWGGFSDTIGRANLDGTDTNPALITGPRRPCAVALDANHIYWREQGTGLAEIGRASLDGTTVNRPFLSDIRSTYRCDIAVDSLSFAPPPPQPPVASTCRLGKANVNRRKPVVFLPVFGPVHGEIAVLTRGLRSKVVTPPSPPWMGGRKVRSLKIWLRAKGRAAHRLRRRLARTGKASIALRIRCHGINEAPTVVERGLTLRRFLRNSGPVVDRPAGRPARRSNLFAG